MEDAYSTTGIVLAQEGAQAFYDEGLVRGLFANHLKEVGFGKSEVELNVDIKELVDMESKGNHAVFVARTLDNEIVGYIGFVMHLYIHLSHKLAQAYTTYVVPEYRKSKVATKLVQFSESMLYHKHHCKYIQLTSNMNKEIGGFIEKMGYVPTDMVFTKEFMSTAEYSSTVKKGV